jgi:hypothetical protein
MHDPMVTRLALLLLAGAVAEPTVFEAPGECSISADLRVSGPRRRACVERLETAARLARAEMRVNEGKRRGR